MNLLAPALPVTDRVARAGVLVLLAALGGLMQRCMFLIADAWYGAEAVALPEARG